MTTDSRLDTLSLGTKFGAVIGGYIAATLLASAAVAVRMMFASGPDTQASSGMYAFGDAVVFVGIFGLCALFPTAAALLFLRSCDSFWKAISVLGVAIASTGVAATIVYATGRHANAGPVVTWAAFSVLRILIAPLLVLTFTVCASIAPRRPIRIALVTGGLLEAAVSVYAGVVWIVPLLTERR